MGTWRNNYINMTSKRRRFNVIITLSFFASCVRWGLFSPKWDSLLWREHGTLDNPFLSGGTPCCTQQENWQWSDQFHIFQCMGKTFSLEFQMVSFKFHTNIFFILRDKVLYEVMISQSLWFKSLQAFFENYDIWNSNKLYALVTHQPYLIQNSQKIVSFGFGVLKC